MADAPPPPPPPHGEKPKTTHGEEYRKASDLPPGNYDIFVIPPHSSGAGFLYLPSLQCHRNSFVAGCVTTFAARSIWNLISPVLKAGSSTTAASGNGLTVVVLIVAVGLAGWAFGMSSAGSSSFRDPKSGGHGPGSGFQWNNSRDRSQANGDSTRGSNHGGNNSYGASSSDQPGGGSGQTNADGKKENEEPKAEQTREQEETRERDRQQERERQREQERQREREAMDRELRERREQLEREITAAAKAAREKAEQEATEAKARAEETRRKAEQEAAETRKRIEKEAAEAKAKTEKEVAEARAKSQKEAVETKMREMRAAAAAKAQADKEAAKAKEKADQEAAEAKAKAEREAAEKEAAARATAKKEADAKFAALKEAAAKKYAEKKARDAKEAMENAARTARPTSNSGAPRTPSPKKPKSYADSSAIESDASTCRPYERPRRPYASAYASSAHSESSYSPSQTTAQSSPPPSGRNAYSTNDPDKIVIKGVYAFNNTFVQNPFAQLVSGEGMITDGLVLRMTTEGLFIDDDLRGVPEREWDVKAWTLKLFEVWCPQVGSTTTRQNPPKSSFWRSTAHGVPNAEESEACLTNLLKVCKNRCRVEHLSPHSGRTGGFDGDSTQNLHILRANLRDQEGKKYVFVLQETEGWKVPIGIQRLRGGTQVRALGISNMAANDRNTLLGRVGWT